MSAKIKILVVDDEVPLAKMMAYLLTRAGCEVETATNAEQAVCLVQAADFDLITLDMDLPDGNGFEIFARLKKLSRWQNPPVIFVTGRPCDEDRHCARELGAVDFISKPFDMEGFVSRIKSHAKVRPRPSDIPDENADADTQRFCNAP